MENTLIKLTLHDETKKRAHDSQIVRAKENLKLSHGGSSYRSLGMINVNRINVEESCTSSCLYYKSLLSLKAATLIFISWRGSATSSAMEWNSGFINNLVKS